MKRYAVGIDLGTSSSSLAYSQLIEDGQPGEIHPLDILQSTGPGEFRACPTLPSFITVPENEDDSSIQLPPWPQYRPAMLGEYSRRLAVERPGQTIHSAKSWLCHEGVDRLAPILPWGTSPEKGISPFDCIRLQLEHIRCSFEEQLQVPLSEQQVTIGVPASFDPAARQLTSRAAMAAGIPEHRLLEEPQAAFYAWLQKERRASRKILAGSNLLLVCDVGGGTTDFTLIRVSRDEQGAITLERIAVGDHLIIGGDNMDLALAHLLEKQAGMRLDAPRFNELVQRCREAKEALLTGGTPSLTVEVHGRGRKVVGGSVQVSLDRNELRQFLNEGFFPDADWETQLVKVHSGLREMGLPYTPDPRITVHLKEFLRASLPAGEFPDLLLLHGGVFAAHHLAERVTTALEHLYPGEAILPLPAPDLFRGVSTGTAYASTIQACGSGLRVISGSPRSYFLGIDLPDGTPGALCLVPRNTPGGTAINLDQPLLARANEAVSFPIYSTDRGDLAPGETCPLTTSDFRGLPPLTTTLKFGKRSVPRPLRVRLEGEYTEVGTLALRLESQESDHVFDLDFNLRHRETPLASSSGPRLPVTVREKLANCLEEGLLSRDEYRLRHLAREMEDIAGSLRTTWSATDLRALAETLLDLRIKCCRQSRAHEEVWFNLTGFFLRPGTGCPGDEDRLLRLYTVLRDQPVHSGAKPVRTQQAIMLRRLAAGLSAAHQEEFYRRMKSDFFAGRKFSSTDQERCERLRAAVSLEMLPREWKQELGEALLEQAHRFLPGPLLPWLLSRLANRRPFHGTADRLLSGETAALWVEFLLSGNSDPFAGQALCLARMIQRTGDRMLDLPEDTFLAGRRHLVKTGYHELLDLVDGKKASSSEMLNSMLGDTLPSGLALPE